MFLRGVDLAELGTRLRQTDRLALAVSPFLAVLSLWFRSLKLGLMLPDREGTNRRGLMANVCTGFMVNNIIPARAGEAVRGVLLWKHNRFPGAVAVGALLLERGIDVMVFMLFFAGPVLLFGAAPHLRPYALAVAVMLVATILCFVLYAFVPKAAVRIGDWGCSLLPGRLGEWAARTFHDILTTLDWVHNWRRVVSVSVLSVLTMACYGTIVFLLARHDGSFSITDGLCASAFAAIGAAIPLSPGYVGTLHAALGQGLVTLGISTESAAALAIIYHALTYLPTTLVGLFYFSSLKIDLKEIASEREHLQ